MLRGSYHACLVRLSSQTRIEIFRLLNDAIVDSRASQPSRADIAILLTSFAISSEFQDFCNKLDELIALPSSRDRGRNIALAFGKAYGLCARDQGVTVGQRQQDWESLQQQQYLGRIVTSIMTQLSQFVPESTVLNKQLTDISVGDLPALDSPYARKIQESFIKALQAKHKEEASISFGQACVDFAYEDFLQYDTKRNTKDYSVFAAYATMIQRLGVKGSAAQSADELYRSVPEKFNFISLGHLNSHSSLKDLKTTMDLVEHVDSESLSRLVEHARLFGHGTYYAQFKKAMNRSLPTMSLQSYVEKNKAQFVDCTQPKDRDEAWQYKIYTLAKEICEAEAVQQILQEAGMRADSITKDAGSAQLKEYAAYGADIVAIVERCANKIDQCKDLSLSEKCARAKTLQKVANGQLSTIKTLLEQLIDKGFDPFGLIKHSDIESIVYRNDAQATLLGLHGELAITADLLGRSGCRLQMVNERNFLPGKLLLACQNGTLFVIDAEEICSGGVTKEGKHISLRAEQEGDRYQQLYVDGKPVRWSTSKSVIFDSHKKEFKKNTRAVTPILQFAADGGLQAVTHEIDILYSDDQGTYMTEIKSSMNTLLRRPVSSWKKLRMMGEIAKLLGGNVKPKFMYVAACDDNTEEAQVLKAKLKRASVELEAVSIA